MSNEQQRLDRDSNTEEGCQKPALRLKTADDEYD